MELVSANNNSNAFSLVSQALAQLVQESPCTKKLKKPLVETIDALHRCYQGDETASNEYTGASLSLMAELKDCLLEIGPKLKPRFEAFLANFSSKLPQLLALLNGQTKQEFCNEAALDAISGAEFENVPTQLTLELQGEKASNQAELEVNNPESLLKYVKLAIARNRLVSRASDHQIKSLIYLAEAVRQQLTEGQVDLVALQEKFQTGPKAKMFIGRALASWQKRHKLADLTKVKQYEAISVEQAEDLLSNMQRRFQKEKPVSRLDLLPDFVNLSKQMEAIQPAKNKNADTALEGVLLWYLNFSNYSTKQEFYNENPGLQHSFKKALGDWNKLFEV